MQWLKVTSPDLRSHMSYVLLLWLVVGLDLCSVCRSILCNPPGSQKSDNFKLWESTHSELQTNVSFNASVSNLQTRRLLLHCTTALFNKCFEPASWWCLRLFSDSFYTKSSQWVKHGVLEKSCATYFWQAAKKIKQEFPWLHWLVFVLIQIMWCI